MICFLKPRRSLVINRRLNIDHKMVTNCTEKDYDRVNSYPEHLQFCRAKRGLCHHAVFVCASVTFVYSVKTNKRIFKLFSPSGNHTILIFYTKHYSNSNISTRIPLTRASSAVSRQKSRFWNLLIMGDGRRSSTHL